MFEISPKPIQTIREQLKPFASEIPLVWAALDLSSSTVQHKRPFVQLSVDEMPADEVDRLLGYAGIPKSNGPIGLPLSFEPLLVGIEVGARLLLFPLDGLEHHLKEVAPEVAAALDGAGSMDAYAEIRGDEMTAREYLVAGVIECIRFCRDHNEALVFHW